MDIVALILSALAVTSWLMYLPYAALTLYSLKNIPKYETQVDISTKAAGKLSKDKSIIFRFVTKGNSQRLINTGITSIINSCDRLNFKNYTIEIVTDSPKDRFNDKATTIVVPADYETPNKTRFKARALNYAIEHHTKISKHTWILHLDDETNVTIQAVHAILSYLDNDPKVAAEGAINYPNEFGRNYITSLLEGERALSCLFCIEQIDFDPIWLHGSNLLVRSDVEKVVGWDFGADSVAEDARFGYELTKKIGSKAIGWHGGTLLEQPTFTIKDTIKQRQRWFIGAIRNIKYMHSLQHKIVEIYFLGTWTLGFFASFVGIFALLNYLYVPLVLKPVLVFCLVVWAMGYQIGLYLNMRHLKLSVSDKILYHLAAFVLLPVLGIVSTFPTVLSIFKRPKTFEIVQKEDRPAGASRPQPIKEGIIRAVARNLHIKQK